MNQIDVPAIDLSAYMPDGDPTAKVIPASNFRFDLRAAFRPRDHKATSVMESTKLRDVIEFRKGEVTTWAGYSGHRKSMFCGQVALDLMANGRKVLIASLEMQPTSTLARMARQACGSGHPDDQWLDAFSTWTDERLWMFDHVGRITPETCIAVCRYAVATHGVEHVFIDSMMMVCGSEESLDEQKQFMTDLVRLAKETELHVHVVAHCRKPPAGNDDQPPSKYDVRGSSAITDQAHNVVTIWANKAKQSKLRIDPMDGAALEKPDAAATICKQRNGDFEGRLSLWFHGPSLRFCDDRIHRVEPMQMMARLERVA